MKTLSLLLLTTLALHANPDRFRELFADPNTREEALGMLTPGTESWYFHTALNHQLEGRSEQYRDTIEAWWTAAMDKKSPIGTSNLETLERRSLLLRYDTDPEDALQDLADEWDFSFDHTKPDSAAEERSLPTAVDPSWIAAQAFRKEQARLSGDYDYRNYSQHALYYKLNNLDEFDRNTIVWYVNHFQLTHHPYYDNLLAKALNHPQPVSAGSIEFDRLTLKQMNSLRSKVPSLASSEHYNTQYLAKLSPALPLNPERNPEQHADFLAKCWDYAKDLPPSQIDLKAYLLHHHLRLQQQLGNHPKEDFYTYLAMPRRNHPWICTDKKSDYHTSFTNRLNNITGCDSVYQDAQLIESYLEHFLAGSDKIDPKLKELIKKDRLAKLHARTRILAGADPKIHAPTIGAEQYRQLREETRIEFAKQVRREFKSDDDVILPVLLKNTPTLLIRIYELQGRKAYQQDSADMDLDGLVPHYSRKLQFEKDPNIRHLSQVALPELKGAGTWIVELVSEGISARALIRKGLISPYITRSAEGQEVRLYDETNQAVTDFTIELGSESYRSKNGVCLVPNTANSPRNKGMIVSGKLVSPIHLYSRDDDLELSTRFLLDQEQLLAGKQAVLRLRNHFTNHGETIDFKRLDNATLVMKAQLLGGVTTERVITDSLILGPSNEVEFLVPENLLSLSLHLSATAQSKTDPKPINFEESQTYQLNHALQTAHIGMALFSPTKEGTMLELRGRNGEPLASHPISVTFRHLDYEARIRIRLRSDEDGRIQLGDLASITEVTVKSSSIATTSHQPMAHRTELPTEYLVSEQDTLRIPDIRPQKGSATAGPTLHRLVTHVGSDASTVVENLKTQLTEDNGFLVLANLKPGRYHLQQGDSEISIQVLPASSRKDKLLITDDRILPRSIPASPLISEAASDKDLLKIRIAGASEQTRVSVIGKRYDISDWVSGSAVHPFAPSSQQRVTRGYRTSSFLTNRRIGDELRYILARRNVNRYPGVMLPRPGQLLHRWTPENLDQGDLGFDEGGGGGSFGGVGRGGQSFFSGRADRDASRNSRQIVAIDFLDQPASIEFNLKPDANGRLDIPAAKFKDAQYLHIIASDAEASDEVIVALEPSAPSTRDRSLTRPLAADSHHIATRSAASLAPNAEAEIRNLLDADWRAFTTLEQAHQFLLGNVRGDSLRRFLFLSKWPELKRDEKVQLLAEHHCHEFHLFLFRKDRDFFNKHVRDLLMAKPQPQFMDDYLLERDLSKYLKIHAFAQLNAAEKALLAQAMPDSRKTISRELELRWQKEAPPAEAQTVLFAKTLKGADLDRADSLGMASIRKIREANELLMLAESSYNLGKYDEAFRAYKRALTIDPYNATARRGLERVASAKSDYYSAAYDQTRAELLDEVDASWEINAAVQAFPTAPANPSFSGAAYISEKLSNITIPSINFQDTTVEDAIEFLRMRAAELDNTELDPSHKGVSFVVRAPNGGYAEEIDDELVDALGSVSGIGGDPGNVRIDNLQLSNVPLDVALKQICEKTGLRYKIDNYAVTLLPQTESGEDLYTRSFTVPPDFRSRIAAGASGGVDDSDPFAPASGGSSAIEGLPTIVESLKRSGVSFPEGASATLVGNKLVVFNSPSELDKIDMLTSSLRSQTPKQVKATTKHLEVLQKNSEELGFDWVAEPFFSSGQPRFVDRTQSWLESNYFQYRGKTGENLIPLNRFWLELSTWDGVGAFTSPHFNTCTTSSNDALMCLALLDLPFSAEAPEVSVEKERLKIKARTPMLLFYKDTRKTDQIAAESPLLVRQSYHPLSEPFRNENGRQVENTHVGDFRTGTAYGLSLVITNPTGIERRIETLAQIPAGSIPLTPMTQRGDKSEDAPATLSTSHKLKPFGVIRLQLAFYFPTAGEYSAYPLHVAEDGTILAHAEARTLRVVDEPAPEDSASWNVLARDGSSEAVINRLKTANPADIDLSKILWRLKEREFFHQVTAILGKRLWQGEGATEVFSYGIHHNDAQSISSWLELNGTGQRLGSWFNCKLIQVTPTSHHGWELLEFDPLINPRAHAYGDQARFTHGDAHAYYQGFLDDLAWKAELSDSDQLTYTYLLLLQDRNKEAIERFAKINPEGLPTRLQYDYFKSVILFLQEQPEQAAKIAKTYDGKLTAGTWRDRFDAVLAQAEEIQKPMETRPEAEAREFSALALAQDPDQPGQLLLKHRSIKNAEIQLYHIDLEILFSKDPFLEAGLDTSLPPIEPNLVAEVKLAEDQKSTTYQLPEAFRKGNILVAAQSGEYKQLKIMDSQALDLSFDPIQRSLQVFDPLNDKVLPKTYIKVYRELDDGSVEFHKDGYTDLRGKFDYLSHTGAKLSKIKRLAILASHPEMGARTSIIRR